MNSSSTSNTLAIIGLVVGVIALLFSFIPCLGTVAIFPGLVAAVIGVIAYFQARDNGSPKGMPLSVIIVSIIACLISVFQIVFIGNAAQDMKTDLPPYEDCAQLKLDLSSNVEKMKVVTKDLDEGNSPIANMKKITQLGINLDHMKKESLRLNCDIDFENMESDPNLQDEDQSEDSEATQSTEGESQEG